ncbi:MAG: zinc-ribbon domain-containing protein [Candidatus Bathyarchaeota archaeon]|nr:zinc-ribbon domain-containing protein [Candidatus Bathyarchaeota archaeon]
MSYCSNCGAKLPKDALYCPKCGAKTVMSAEKPIVTSEDLRETLNRIEKEFEKAFAVAVKEMQAAFKKAKESVQQEPPKETVTCSNCGEKNPKGAIFCYNCGTKLEPKAEEKS